MSGALPAGFVVDGVAGDPLQGLPADLPDGFRIDAPHPVSGPSGNLLTDAGRFAGTVGANTAAALLATPNAVAQGVDWLGGKVGLNPGVAPALGSIPTPGRPNTPLFPDFQTARDMAFNTTGGTEYQPQTWAGRRGMDAATGAALALSGGNVEALPVAAGGSATAGAASELFPEYPLLASMLGFIPGAAATRMAVTGPQRLAGALTGAPASEPAAAFQRLGLPMQLGGTVTGDPALQFAEKFAARMPGSEAAVATAKDNLVNAWQDKLDQTASSLGSAATPAEAGQSLQSGAQQWLQSFKDRTSGLWNKFHAMVPGETPVDVTGYKGALDNVLSSFPGAPATGAALRPPPAAGLERAISADTAAPPMPTPRVSGVLDEFGKPVTVEPSDAEMANWMASLPDAGKLPWEAVKNIRSAIGERLENPQLVSDMSQGALKQLYAGLSRDMENGAASVSPDALTAFHTANAATAAGRDLLDTQIGGVLKAKTPEQATQYAMSQARLGGSRLGALAFNLPGAAGDLGSYALRNMAGAQDNPSALANAMLGRRPALSQEAQGVLFPQPAPALGIGGATAPPIPSAAQNIADLAATGRAMQPLERDLANSPTATHQTRGLGRIITAVELARQGHEMFGTPGAIAGGALGVAAPNLMGRVAQMTALNPMLTALAARRPGYIPPNVITPLGRALISPALGAPPPSWLPAYRAATATSATTPPQ